MYSSHQMHVGPERSKGSAGSPSHFLRSREERQNHAFALQTESLHSSPADSCAVFPGAAVLEA